MSESFATVQEAFGILADPADARWAEAFGFLAAQPETAQLMRETFRDTLREMGAEAGGVDPATGEPMYTLADVARALGIPETDLDRALADAEPGSRHPGPDAGA